ncbi:hypothetical protein DTO166G4_5853 [Paecilomyces variotii]|nr:hypothetical protein DTO032I3_7545 [Paecilomyces variotii]KAJ9212492.1 hypothetical protein DTO166G4_5853 [Paecilomyces variotii]KAJ9237015.1 hypothetical protein DTO166G5_3700 [Paecilomyces variotii]KAJ9238778.1 hypothetical protein DTO169E5_4611 [Paecilomyces variotii]KAJ9258615.1 hypothetical protein DTO207G8_1318 [Paecilomyces variotii]
MFLPSLSLGLLLSSSVAYGLPTNSTASNSTPSPLRPHNDFSCRSTEYPNPVVLLHGLGATYYEDLNYLEAWLQIQGHCTFSITYGAYDGFPFVGGLKPINESAQEIASFIQEVQTKTGADKINLVGHSEGAFQSLYVPKFTGVSPIIDKIVAIAPPTHGTTFANLWDLAYLLGNGTREAVGDVLRAVGCAACDDLSVGGAAIAKLNDGTPIHQPGNQLTVIASKDDELVTPSGTASWVEEDGVTNEYVQNTCSFDPVGHIGEAYDLNVWNLVKNALEGTPDRAFTCVVGSPGKR